MAAKALSIKTTRLSKKAASGKAGRNRKSITAKSAENAPHTLLDALHRAIEEDSGSRLTRAAEALLDRAAGGEHWAIKELADRLDGRPNPATGERRRPVTVEVVRFADSTSE